MAAVDLTAVIFPVYEFIRHFLSTYVNINGEILHACNGEIDLATLSILLRILLI